MKLKTADEFVHYIFNMRQIEEKVLDSLSIDKYAFITLYNIDHERIIENVKPKYRITIFFSYGAIIKIGYKIKPTVWYYKTKKEIYSTWKKVVSRYT